MITYLWAVGLVLALLILAVKTGLLAGMLKGHVLLTLSVFTLIYGGISFLVGLILIKEVFTLTDYFLFFQQYASSGVLIHLFVGFVVLGTGIYLIRLFVNGQLDKSFMVILLLLPSILVCILCLLLSTIILRSATELPLVKVVGVVVTAFGFTVAATILWSKRMRQKRDKEVSPVPLGFGMIMLGLYFIASTIIVPAYAQSGAVLQAAQNTGRQVLPLNQLLIILACVSGIVGLGYLKSQKEVTR